MSVAEKHATEHWCNMYIVTDVCRSIHTTLCLSQMSSGGVSLAVGAERKRGADQQDALQLAAQLGARSQGGGGATTRNGVGGGGGGGETTTDRDKKLKNLKKVVWLY